MISRRTASAALFAVVAAASITFAADARTKSAPQATAAVAAEATPVIVMPMVEVTGRRIVR